MATSTSAMANLNSPPQPVANIVNPPITASPPVSGIGNYKSNTQVAEEEDLVADYGEAEIAMNPEAEAEKDHSLRTLDEVYPIPRRAGTITWYVPDPSKFGIKIRQAIEELILEHGSLSQIPWGAKREQNVRPIQDILYAPNSKILENALEELNSSNGNIAIFLLPDNVHYPRVMLRLFPSVLDKAVSLDIGAHQISVALPHHASKRAKDDLGIDSSLRRAFFDTGIRLQVKARTRPNPRGAETLTKSIMDNQLIKFFLRQYQDDNYTFRRQQLEGLLKRKKRKTAYLEQVETPTAPPPASASNATVAAPVSNSNEIKVEIAPIKAANLTVNKLPLATTPHIVPNPTWGVPMTLHPPPKPVALVHPRVLTNLPMIPQTPPPPIVSATQLPDLLRQLDFLGGLLLSHYHYNIFIIRDQPIQAQQNELNRLRALNQPALERQVVDYLNLYSSLRVSP